MKFLFIFFILVYFVRGEKYPLLIPFLLDKNLETTPETLLKEQGTLLDDFKNQCGFRNGPYLSRIVGSSKADKGEFPWQISIQLRTGFYTQHVCGGAIIHPKWIITAAHCIDMIHPATLVIIAGDHDLYISEGTEQRRFINNVVIKDFDKATFNSDIALLELNKPLIFNQYVAPICLPETNQTFPDDLATISGWGRLNENSTTSVRNLQQATLPFISKDKCWMVYIQVGLSSYLNDCQICAGANGKDACQGDSGGPLACKGDKDQYYLCGIVSWGVGCARPKFPGIYTKVTCFLDWIKSIISDNIYK